MTALFGAEQRTVTVATPWPDADAGLSGMLLESVQDVTVDVIAAELKLWLVNKHVSLSGLLLDGHVIVAVLKLRLVNEHVGLSGLLLDVIVAELNLRLLSVIVDEHVSVVSLSRGRLLDVIAAELKLP